MKTYETYLLDRAKVEGAHLLATYKKLGGYKGLEKTLKSGMTPAAVVDEMKKSGLRGRGGAGFSTGTKWAACRAAPGLERRWSPHRASTLVPRYWETLTPR